MKIRWNKANKDMKKWKKRRIEKKNKSIVDLKNLKNKDEYLNSCYSYSNEMKYISDKEILIWRNEANKKLSN